MSPKNARIDKPESQREIDALKRRVAELEQLNAQLTQGLADSKRHEDSLEGRISAAAKENEQLRGDNLQAAAENQQLKVDSLQAAAQNEQLRVDTLQAAAENKQLRGDNLQAAAENKQLKVDNLKAATENQQLRGDNLQAAAQNEQLRGDNLQAAAENQQLKVDNLQASADNKQLRGQLDASTRRDQLQQAIDQLRQQVWKMRDPQDINTLLPMLRQSIADLGIDALHCHISLFGKTVRDVVLDHAKNGDEDWSEIDRLGADYRIARIWYQGKVLYRSDLHAADPLGERADIETHFGHAVRSVLDVPFSHGTLGLLSDRPDAFSPDDILIIHQMTEMLSDGFRRLDDLRTQERLNIRYSQLLETPSMAVMLRQPDGRFDYISPQIERMSGYPAAEWQSDPGLKQRLIHPDDLPKLQKALHSVLHEYLEVAVEFRLKHRDEEGYRWITEEIFPLLDSEDRVVAYQAVMRDVSDRKAAENEKDRLAAVVEASGEAIMSADLEGNILSWNTAAERLFGHRAEEVIGQSTALLTPPDERAQFGQVIQSLLDGAVSRTVEATRQHKDGRQLELSMTISPIRDTGNRIVGISTIARDIGRRRRRERLAQLNAEVGTALATSDDLDEVLQRSTEAIVHRIDAAFARVWTLDQEHDELVLQASAGMYTHIDGDHARVPVGKFKIGLIASEGMPHITNDVQHDPRVGDPEWARREGMVSFAGYPLIIDNRVIGVVALFARQPLEESVLDALESVSRGLALYIDRKRKELELLETHDRAQSANKAKSTFLANMSHELRTPMNSIIGFGEILYDQLFGPLNKKQTQYIDNILKSGHHLLGLINDVLDLSKIEAERMELDLQEVDVARTVEDVCRVTLSLVEKKQIDMQVNLNPDLTPIAADQTKFKQILYNLLSNAIKFTPKNGRVGLNVCHQGEMLRVAVSDTGPGIAPENHERVFAAFEQVNRTTGSGEGGTGLGLALTRRLVELHGGRIWVESEGDGSGSVFTFEVPTVQTDSTDEDHPIKGDGPLAMVVEDDPHAGELINLYLQEAGYSVIVMRRGAEAVKSARALRPQIITLDIMLPDRDGWSVLKDLKDDPETQDIPIVVVSVTADRELAMPLGAVECFTKPIDRHRLIECVDRALAEKSAGARVLVVDDDPPTVDLICEVLSSYGHQTVRAYNGQEALDAVFAAPPDLIVLDLVMPEVDGFEVVETLRQRPEYRQLPILIYTGKELTNDERRQLDQHVERVVMKGAQGKRELLHALSMARRLDPRPKPETRPE